MFETLSRSRPRRPAAGTAVSIALHLVVIGAVLWFTRVHSPAMVVILDRPVRPPPRLGDSKPTGPTAPSQHHPRSKHPRPKTLIQPVEPPPPAVEAPALVADEPASEPEEVGQPGVYGGDPNGSPTGVIGSTEIVGHEGPQPFDEGRMTPPRLLSGPNPQYTEEAVEHEIEGVMAVRCVVTEQGTVHGCRVLKGLPYLDAAVIQSLERRRYSPATIAGRPVEVDYLFKVQMRLPR